MNNVVQYTKQLAKLHSIDINKSFTQSLKKLYRRDDDRWEKK